MRTSIILLLGFIPGLSLISCNQKQALKTELEPIMGDSIMLEEPALSELDSVFQIQEEYSPALFLSFARTPCYGQCPVYSVKVYSNGTLFYRGRKYVERVGYFSASLTLEQLEEISMEAEELGFFELSNLYPSDGNMITDIPNVVISLYRDKEKKEVVVNYQAPPALMDFIEKLEGLLLSMEWLQVPDPLNSN